MIFSTRHKFEFSDGRCYDWINFHLVYRDWIASSARSFLNSFLRKSENRIHFHSPLHFVHVYVSWWMIAEGRKEPEEGKIKEPDQNEVTSFLSFRVYHFTLLLLLSPSFLFILNIYFYVYSEYVSRDRYMLICTFVHLRESEKIDRIPQTENEKRFLPRKHFVIKNHSRAIPLCANTTFSDLQTRDKFLELEKLCIDACCACIFTLSPFFRGNEMKGEDRFRDSLLHLNLSFFSRPLDPIPRVLNSLSLSLLNSRWRISREKG